MTFSKTPLQNEVLMNKFATLVNLLFIKLLAKIIALKYVLIMLIINYNLVAFNYICNMLNNNKLDKIGICVSVLCAVHCALLPLVVTLLPLIGFRFLANEYFEMAIIATSLYIGYTSLRGSYRKHDNIRPLLIITQGFIIIFIGKILIAQRYEWLLLTTGGLLIATAHFYNSKLSTHLHEGH
jgi:hypothetical protein